MTMRKNSQYTKFFSTVLFDIVSSGQWNFILNRESVATTSCKSSSDLEIQPLGFEKLAFIFVILVSGIIFSLVIILMEFKIPTCIQSRIIHLDIEDNHQEILEKRKDSFNSCHTLHIQSLSSFWNLTCSCIKEKYWSGASILQEF